MKKPLRRALSALLCAALTLSLAPPAGASSFTFPQAYWAMQTAWTDAVAAEDVDATIAAATQIYDLLRPMGLGAEVCSNLENKCARAAWCSEIKGDVDGAVLWLERQLECAQWLTANGADYSDSIKTITAKLEVLAAVGETAIYSLTDEDPAPYAYGPETGTWYGSTVMGTASGESAVLLYIDFMDGYSVDYWLGYYARTSEKLRAALDGGIIELAWNFHPESTKGAQTVLASDIYINEGVATLGALDATVLLRVGAEMNNWNDLDKDTFIAAFRKVAQAAKAYDNIYMVFSPNDVSNWNVTFEDFYPGDEYVDWIGVSLYNNTNYQSRTGGDPSYTYSDITDSYTDAFYCVGHYDSDPLLIIRPLVRFAEAHGKPMMISECGSSYTGVPGSEPIAYAKDQLHKLYSYVNMVYPQVQAVFYFDHTLAGGTTSYAFSGNAEIYQTYLNAIAANGAYLAQGQTGSRNWEELSQANVKLDAGEKLRLAVYASFPGKTAATVTYYLDGAPVLTSSQAPFYYDLDLSSLSAGRHTIYAKSAAGQFTSQTPAYTFHVSDSGMVLSGDTENLEISSADSWAVGQLLDAYGAGLVTPLTGGGFTTPVTRLQFAELVVNLMETTLGVTLPSDGMTFTDTNDLSVRKAAAIGIITGPGDGTFLPNNPITREDIFTLVLRAINYMDEQLGAATLSNTDETIDAARFTDGHLVSGYAVAGVARLTNNGIVGGKGDGLIAPRDQTTVQEAVILILKLSKLY